MKPTAPNSVWSYEGYRLEPGSLVTAMVHLYRAEVGRANLWRNRLDTTTNWAVVTTAAALTFTFSAAENPHFLLLLVLLLVLTFLLIEARRYSYYALWYYRVRLLEIGFFGAMLVPPHEPPKRWAETLSGTLQEPEFLIARWRAVATRVRRNYIWIVSLIMISWVLKLSISPNPADSFCDIVAHAAIGGWIPGGLVVGIVFGLYAGLIGLSIAAALIPAQSGVAQSGPISYQQAAKREAEPREEQMAIIVTNRKEAVAARIMEELHRGVTAMSGTGMYTGQARDVLFTAIPGDREPTLRQIVEACDPEAFVILTAARDIRGRGFAPTEPPH